MIPGLYEFHWDAGHIIFLGVFYSVVLLLLGLVVRSALRAAQDMRSGRAEAIRWSGDFRGLPVAKRACRHQLTGEAPGRVCQRGFDCRGCDGHGTFVSSAEARNRACGAPAGGRETMSVEGFEMPDDRWYHRGHAWARPEPDGTVSVGLDDFASRLIGEPDRIELPAVGARVIVGGTGFRFWKAGVDYRVASPVDGEVVSAEGAGTAILLRVRPEKDRFDPTHLLRGAEVGPWLLRELEGLQLALGDAGVVGLADGGVPIADLGRIIPEAKQPSVLGAALLDL